MGKRTEAWAIALGGGHYIGVGWFGWEHVKPWTDGMRTCLFRTRAAARRHLGKVKGPASAGRWPNARVERVEVNITAKRRTTP